MSLAKCGNCQLHWKQGWVHAGHSARGTPRSGSPAAKSGTGAKQPVLPVADDDGEMANLRGILKSLGDKGPADIRDIVNNRIRDIEQAKRAALTPEARVQSLYNKVQAKQKQLDSMVAEHDDYTKQINELQSKRDQLEDRIAEVHEQLEKAQADLKEDLPARQAAPVAASLGELLKAAPLEQLQDWKASLSNLIEDAIKAAVAAKDEAPPSTASTQSTPPEEPGAEQPTMEVDATAASAAPKKEDKLKRAADIASAAKRRKKEGDQSAAPKKQQG